MKHQLSPPEWHQLRVAQSTMKMTPAMARIMGGPTHAEAREIIYRLTGKMPRLTEVKFRKNTIKRGDVARLQAKHYGKNPRRRLFVLALKTPQGWRELVTRHKSLGQAKKAAHALARSTHVPVRITAGR